MAVAAKKKAVGGAS